jgi:DNA ligase-1
MKFSELAKYFEKLEETSSRLELIKFLAEVFQQSHHAEEIKIICYLVQGRIAPFYVPLELGMADKMVAQSIGEAYGLSKDEVLESYGKLGDLGLVALQLHDKSKHKGGESWLVEEVFGKLNEIAETKGQGSVEGKTKLFQALLVHADASSAKYLVRIVLGKLRLGIGDPTVLDALLTAKLGDKSQRKVLEGAYNRTSDMGEIAKTLWQHGLKEVEQMKVTVGRPIRSELCERLPNPEKVIEKMVEVDAQYKYDGFRVQIHKMNNDVRIFSRNLEEMTPMFPELIEGARTQIKAKTAILDGEAIAYQPESEEFLPFQETTKRRRKYNIEETAKQLPLKAFIFDILYKDGKSLIDEPLSSRLEILKETIHGDEILIPAKNQKINDAKKLAVMLEESISKGLEGVVIKKLESPYEAGGRNFNWVKLKRHSAGALEDTIDCVILGYIYGRGKRTSFGAGALLVGVYDEKNDEFVTVSKIGTGLSDDEWKSIKERTHGLELAHKPARVNSLLTPSVWVKPEIVIEVLADEITRSPLHTAGMSEELNQESGIKNQGGKLGYALRFPRLVSFRDKDKRAEDATTVKELIAMYGEQGKK